MDRVLALPQQQPRDRVGADLLTRVIVGTCRVRVSEQTPVPVEDTDSVPLVFEIAFHLIGAVVDRFLPFPRGRGRRGTWDSCPRQAVRSRKTVPSQPYRRRTRD